LFFTGFQIGVDLIARFSRVQEITDSYRFRLADPIEKSKKRKKKKTKYRNRDPTRWNPEESGSSAPGDIARTWRRSRDSSTQIRSSLQIRSIRDSTKKKGGHRPRVHAPEDNVSSSEAVRACSRSPGSSRVGRWRSVLDRAGPSR
jgi:hypothetical protein